MSCRELTLQYHEREPIQDACGLVGILADDDSTLFRQGLSALEKLQTRGYNGAGYTALRSDGTVLIHKEEGTISEVFKDNITKLLENIPVYNLQLQVRYGTSGGFTVENVQPFISRHLESNDIFMVSHNGQFSKKKGPQLSDKSDTAQFVDKLRLSEGNTWEERIQNVLPQKGAWSLIIGTADSMFLARDPLGIRPLYFAQLLDRESGKQISVAASETVALDQLGIKTYSEVLPGQIIRFDRNVEGFSKFWLSETRMPKHCIFENVYTEDENGQSLQWRNSQNEVNFSSSVREVRQRCGEQLAREAPLLPNEVDMVIGVPGTGITGGEAYAKYLGLPYVQAIRDKDTPPLEQRTFMQSEIDGILLKVMKHFNFDPELLYGKSVVLVDDSLVRGNITRGLVKLLKEVYGVKEVHIRILCPPIDKRCFLGINTRSQNELIAAWFTHQVEDVDQLTECIRGEIGADSLSYLRSEGLKYAVSGDPDTQGFCLGCMYGNRHPIDEYGNPLQSEAVSNLILEKEIG